MLDWADGDCVWFFFPRCMLMGPRGPEWDRVEADMLA